MATVKADSARCMGYGNCAILAADVLAVDDDGYVTVLQEQVGSDQLARVTAAVRSCPVAALQVTE
jgi:ferredoxin